MVVGSSKSGEFIVRGLMMIYCDFRREIDVK